MNIKECLKQYGLQREVDDFKTFQSVDIDFFDKNGEMQEVQFDIEHVETAAGQEKLCRLFADFCKENGYKTNTVISVTVVKSAYFLDEL